MEDHRTERQHRYAIAVIKQDGFYYNVEAVRNSGGIYLKPARVFVFWLGWNNDERKNTFMHEWLEAHAEVLGVMDDYRPLHAFVIGCQQSITETFAEKANEIFERMQALKPGS